MFHRKLFPTLLIFTLAMISVVWAQTTGNLRGVVMDPDGKPLPGGTVTISSNSLIGQIRSTYTNELGVFRFPSLSPGTYSVEVTMEGLQTVKVPKVEVSLQASANVPIQMKFEIKPETITVVGETPMVDVTDAGLSTSYKNKLLQEAPTQRQMTDLMQLAPGVNPGVGDSYVPSTVAFGSNVQSNSWNVDGVETSSPESGSVQWTVNPDLIQEIQVLAVGAPAEYGNHLGAVFNVVTKKGGNQFHGGASYYYQSDSLTGTNIEINPPNPSCGVECATYTRIQYDNFSSQLGGPILKDKLSFFAGFEYWRDVHTDPNENPAFAPTSKKEKYDLKLTGTLGEKNEVNGFFHHEDWELPWEPLPLYKELSALPDVHGSNPAWGGGWTSTISSNFLLDLNYAGWWSDSVKDSRTGSFEDPFFDISIGIPLFYAGMLNPSDSVTWKNQFKGKATYYAQNFLNSEHEFKFGIQYSNSSVSTNTGIGPNGMYEYRNGDYLYRVYQDPFQYGSNNKDLGFFVDDTVNVNNNLTLNLGLRFDHNIGRMQEFEILTIGRPSVSPAGNFAKTGQKTSGVDVLNWNLISPRLGIIYQPGNDASSKIQGSFGVYYDHNVSGNWDYPPPGLGSKQVFCSSPATRGCKVPYKEFPPENVAINPDLRAPRTLQYSVGYEQQIGQSMVFGTQYVYKSTKDLVGWEILGGKYDDVPFTDLYTGNLYTLLSIREYPIFRKGNDPGDFPGSENLNYFQKYHGLIFTFDKRLSNSWSCAASYAWSRSTGLIPQMIFQGQGFPFPTSIEGRDPNYFVNAEGRLQGDRPHMLRVLSYIQNLPGGLHASMNADFSSGKHHVRTVIAPNDGVILNQGRVEIIMQRGYRIPPITMIDVNVGRRFDLGDKFVARVDGAIFNLLNSDNELGLFTQRLEFPATEFVARNWTQPRRLQIRVGFEF